MTAVGLTLFICVFSVIVYLCVSSRPCCWSSSGSISWETIRPPWRLPACQSLSRDTAPCPGPSRLRPQPPPSQSASPPPILPPNLASPQVSATILSLIEPLFSYSYLISSLFFVCRAAVLLQIYLSIISTIVGWESGLCQTFIREVSGFELYFLHNALGSEKRNVYPKSRWIWPKNGAMVPASIGY